MWTLSQYIDATNIVARFRVRQLHIAVLVLVIVIYVAAKATFIRLLHGKIGFLFFFRPYKGVGPI